MKISPLFHILQVDNIIAATDYITDAKRPLCRFAISVVLYIRSPVSLLLAFVADLPAKYYSTLYAVLWTFDPTIGVVNQLNELTQWLKTRYAYIVTSTKTWIYGPDLSTSRLLLLPPEIRLRIWEALVPRTRCARGDTGITVEHVEMLNKHNDNLLDFVRSKYRNVTRTYPKIPVTFLRTCRQNYEEGFQFLYGTSTFYFTDDRELCHFVNACSPSQQGTIRHLELIARSGWYPKPGSRRDEEVGDWLSNIVLRNSQVPPIMEKLHGLRTFNIEIRVPHYAVGFAEYAQSIYHLLRHVRASKAVTLKLDLRRCSIVEASSYRTTQREWRSHCQEQFAAAARELIHDLKCHIPVAVPNQGVVQTSYILFAILPVQQE